MYIIKRVSTFTSTKKSCRCSKYKRYACNALISSIHATLILFVLYIGLLFYSSNHIEHSCSLAQKLIYLSHYMGAVLLIPYTFSSYKTPKVLIQLCCIIVILISSIAVWSTSSYSYLNFQYVYGLYTLLYSAFVVFVHQKFYKKRHISKKIMPYHPDLCNFSGDRIDSPSETEISIHKKELYKFNRKRSHSFG